MGGEEGGVGTCLSLAQYQKLEVRWLEDDV